MRLSRRPSPPPHPHPRRGRGKKRGEGSAAGPRGRGAGGEPGVSGPRPSRARAEGGRGAPAPRPGPEPALRHDRRSTVPGTWLEFSAIKVHLVWGASPAPRSPGIFSSSGSPRGSGRSLCPPRRLGLRANLRAGLGVSAPGRDRRPGGPRLRLVPSPALPSPCRRQSGGGGRGPFPGGVQGGRAERLSRSRAGGRRGRAGVGTSGRGHPRVASASTGLGRQVAI